MYGSTVCGPEISDYLGHQRLASNQHDFNEKSFPVPSGELIIFSIIKL